MEVIRKLPFGPDGLCISTVRPRTRREAPPCHRDAWLLITERPERTSGATPESSWFRVFNYGSMEALEERSVIRVETAIRERNVENPPERGGRQSD